MKVVQTAELEEALQRVSRGMTGVQDARLLRRAVRQLQEKIYELQAEQVQFEGEIVRLLEMLDTELWSYEE